jgi:uncharacterized protein (TIGR00106 family)
MSVIVDLSIFPIGKGESVHGDVSKAVGIIRASGLSHRLGPMGTSIEGGYDEVMAVVRDCFNAVSSESKRVYMTVKLDYRADQSGRIEEKVRSVEEQLNED